ncbi:hypothetical protein [Bacteroides sp.]|jgi:hypothetical protein|uniref:hypothetical protein n=1 Tax=Bacteroides sp. TaxID=29523 RepID=UPI0025840552|nr:hypothetical protein [Bacteroides sp.]
MERKLIIRNFGAITSAEIILKDFNIFIGEQGAGKLTVTTHSPYLLSTLNNMIEADNVSKLHPEKETEITTLVPKKSWGDFNRITAYKIENGNVISILDKEFNIVVADQIDATSDEQGWIFSALLDLE